MMYRPEPEYRSVTREYTPEEERLLAEAQARLAANWDVLMAEGQVIANQIYAEHDELEPLFKSLKAEREAQGISLEDMAARLDMMSETLDRFERQVLSHPSITIIQRYAKELGMRLTAELAPAK